jgi:hypothetical protein
MQRHEGTTRGKTISGKAGASHFNLAEDAHLLGKSTDELPSATGQDAADLQNPDHHHRLESTSRSFGFPVLLSFSRSNKIRRKYFTLS